MFGLKPQEITAMISQFYEGTIKPAIDTANTAIDEIKVKYATTESLNSISQAQNQAQKSSQTKIDALEKTVENLSARLREQANSISTLQDSQQRAHIVSQAIQPSKSEAAEITLDDLKVLAAEVADKAYQKIRDYFLLEMAKKGYANERPDFEISERDSRLVVKFQEVNRYNRQNNGFEYKQHPSQCGLYIENMGEFRRQKETPSILCAEPRHYNQNFSFGLPYSYDSGWGKQLAEDLPLLMQAYMLGYTLRCLEKSTETQFCAIGSNFEVALAVQQTHGLTDNPALLEKMSTIMQQDPNLANAFVAHHEQLGKK